MKTPNSLHFKNPLQPILLSALLAWSWAAGGQTRLMYNDFDTFGGGEGGIFSTNCFTPIAPDPAFTWVAGSGLTNSDSIIQASTSSTTYTNQTFDFSTPGRQYIMTVWAKYSKLSGSGKPWGQLGLVNGSYSNGVHTTGPGSAVSLMLWYNSGNSFQMRCANRAAGAATNEFNNLTTPNQPINQTWYANRLTVNLANLDRNRILLSGQFDQYSWTTNIGDPLVYGETRHKLEGYVVTNADLATSSVVWFGLRARTGGGASVGNVSPYSGMDMWEVSEAPAPQPPDNFTTAMGDGFVSLNWKFSTYALGHNVYRSASLSGPWVQVASLAITNGGNTWVTNANFSKYSDSGLVLGSTYYYYVTATNLVGESLGSPTNSILFSPPVQNLVALGGTNQVALSWNQVILLGGATNYTVYRSEVSGSGYAAIGTTGSGSITTFVDTTVACGKRYYYYVQGDMSNGSPSGASSEVNALTAACLPTGLSATSFGPTAIKLAWASADVVAATTIVQASSDGGSTWAPAGATLNGGKAFFLTVPPGATRFLRAYATNSTGFSGISGVVSASAPAAGAIGVNFIAPDLLGGSATTPGYLNDTGQVYGVRVNGYTYGWDIDNGPNMLERGNGPDDRFRTMARMSQPGGARVWEIALPNGLYQVHIGGGDTSGSGNSAGPWQYNVEGIDTLALRGPTPSADFWPEVTRVVNITDGALTITNGFFAGSGSTGNKISFVDIMPVTPIANTIVSQPQSLMVQQNAKAEFSVTVSGGPEPYGYQWYSNSVAIPGATKRTYTIESAQAGDAGTYQVLVSNAGASVASSTATLTVNLRTVPQLLSAGSIDGNSIGLAFDETLDPAAADPTLYAVDSGGAVAVTAAELRWDQKTVRLTLGSQITGAFTVYATNVPDALGNTNTLATFSGSSLGWADTDIIGSSVVAGNSFTADNGTIEIEGGGADILGSADNCHYVYTSVSGDFDARVRMKGIVPAAEALGVMDQFAKNALMVRETTAAGSPNLVVDATGPYNQTDVNLTHPRDQFETTTRSVADGGTTIAGDITYFRPASMPDCYARLVRIGSQFRSYGSSNGVDWIQTWAVSSPLANNLLLGLGVTAHDSGLLARGTFSDFSLGAPAPDVALTKSCYSVAVPTGGTVYYTLTIKNQGAAAASSVTVSDTLPAGLTYVSSTASAGSASFSAGTVTWNAGALAVDATATLTIQAAAFTTGTKLNTASLTAAGDNNSANNLASVSVIVASGPTISNPSYNIGTTTFGLSFATVRGLSYVVQYADTLTTPTTTWHTLTTVSGDGSTRTVQDPTATGNQRYYRILATQP